MLYYCVGMNTTILRLVNQLGTLFASDASFWCYININELYIKKRLYICLGQTNILTVVVLNNNDLGLTHAYQKVSTVE